MLHTSTPQVRRAVALLAALLSIVAGVPAQAAGALDKARDTGKLSFGYRADTRPFSYTDDGGKAAGYSVALCRRVADAVKDELKLPELAVDFVPVTAANRFDALKGGQIDLLCGTATPTLERRAQVDFSIPVFQSGVGAVVRIDAAQRLREALTGVPEGGRPTWRAAPGALAQSVVFAVVGGTTIEQSLLDALKARRITVTVAPVADYAVGLQMVRERRAAALFGDRPVLADAVRRGPSAGELLLIDRNFKRETLALALQRGDDAFRLLVDRTLSRLFRSRDMGPLYTSHFGAPDLAALEFFQTVALPD